MTLQNVIDNLDRTIAGKELLKKSFEGVKQRNLDIGAEVAACAMIEMLDINLDELKRIRADLVLVSANQ